MRPIGSGKELERRRWRSLDLLKSGLLPVDVVSRVGVDRRSVRRWKAAARDGGEQALRARPTKLLARDRRRLAALLLLKGARVAGFPTDLWTGPLVVDVMERRFYVHYHVAYVGRLLRALGFSPQKPTRRVIERDEVAIRRKVTPVFSDEVGFLMAPLVRRTWAPHGMTPILPQRGRSRRKVSVIAALTISLHSHRVRSYFGLLPDANYDGQTILHFLKQLTRGQCGPIDLVWDRLPAHRGEPVGRWLATSRHRVHAHLLPGYSPDSIPSS